MNARFWELVNMDYVKITLRPDQALRWSSGGPTDEGWSARSMTWEHCGSHVSVEVVDDGADCDGRLTTTSNYMCPLFMLHARVSQEGFTMPTWKKVNSHIYDQYAQAAGY